jgi:two-component system sensor histidine kinase BaeS
VTNSAPSPTPPGTPTVPVAATPGSSRGLPLALRLALILSGVTLVTLLVAGAVVNRVVSRSFDDVVAAQQTEQVQAAADALGEILRQGGNLREARAVLERLSRSLGVPVVLLGPDGNEIGQFGPPSLPVDLDDQSHEIEAEVTVGEEHVATITAVVPVQPSGDRPFLRVFNTVLLVGGLAAVCVIAGLSVLIARRQTKPLHDVAVAAGRLEAGDLGARATGGGDRESRELAGAFNSMASRVERSEMLRRRAATDMAHDLATPATVLESQLQAMIDGVVPKNAANLEAARASASALGSVIVQMGELASAEAAPLQARPERVEMAALLAEAAAALEGLYREKSVTLEVDAGEPGLAAWADAAHLGRALRNVMTNAAQHTPAGQAVRVSAVPAARSAGEQVQIRVIDHGTGIPEEDLPHVFERFYRSDPARTAGSGAGIGLTIARELLAPSGGVISVEQTGPDGTTMLLALPRRTEE